MVAGDARAGRVEVCGGGKRGGGAAAAKVGGRGGSGGAAPLVVVLGGGVVCEAWCFREDGRYVGEGAQPGRALSHVPWAGRSGLYGGVGDVAVVGTCAGDFDA